MKFTVDKLSTKNFEINFIFVIKLDNKHTTVLSNSTSRYDMTTGESSCFYKKANDLALQLPG